MKGQSLFRTIGCAFFLSAVLLSFCSCSQPCHPSDYDNSLVSCQAGSGKVIFHYRNLTTNRSSTAEVREKDVSASSQVMPVSSFGDYFLVYGRQDTLIADGKQLAVYPLHHARCSAIGEDNSEIYCYAYEDSRTSLLAYDKKKHTSAPIAVLADTPDLIENKGWWESQKQCFCFTFADSSGTWIAAVSPGGRFSKRLLSPQKMNEILKAAHSGNFLILYKGYDCDSRLDSFHPELLYYDTDSSKLAQRRPAAPVPKDSHATACFEVSGQTILCFFDSGKIRVFEWNGNQFLSKGFFSLPADDTTGKGTFRLKGNRLFSFDQDQVGSIILTAGSVPKASE